MSMISELVRQLKNTADALKPTDTYLFKLLSEASETISTLSAKLYNYDVERASNFYQGKIPCLVKINNMPMSSTNKYIVVKKEGNELWYYNDYYYENVAYETAEYLGDAIVIERVE